MVYVAANQTCAFQISVRSERLAEKVLRCVTEKGQSNMCRVRLREFRQRIFKLFNNSCLC